MKNLKSQSDEIIVKTKATTTLQNQNSVTLTELKNPSDLLERSDG